MRALNLCRLLSLPHRVAPVWLAVWAAVALCGAGTACSFSRTAKPKLEPVAHLDVPRYMGRWFEIAALPNPFQKNCFGTHADYALNPKGGVVVRNSCHKGSLDGPLDGVKGRAWQPDPKVPAALKVQFFWPFSGDYWVLALDKHYGWAVAAQRSRK